MGVVYKFPDENISNAEKDSIDFGKKYGDAILSKHETTMYKRKHDFDLLRPIYGGNKKPVLRANSAHIALYGKSLCEKRQNFT